jgi:hypothetical protein
VACSFGFGLWVWPLEASHYGRPSGEAVGLSWPKVWSLDLAFEGFTLGPAKGSTYYIFTYTILLAHFFGLSTKFGHSIPRPLDLDGHSVKRPLVCSEPGPALIIPPMRALEVQRSRVLSLMCGVALVLYPPHTC